MSQPSEPAYPGDPWQPPRYPGATPPQPQMPHQPPPQHQAPPPQPPPAPDDLEYRNSPGHRVHYKAYQRGTDATAVGQLALHLPGFLMSLVVVLMASGILDSVTGLPYWIPTLLWIASGVLVFHRPTEDCFARYLLKLQRPMPQEAARLEPVWREVTARAGVDGRRYELWIENSQELNAYAAAGHIVGVTRFALERLPSAQLAAVLAHELGHHTGGHTWSSLLGSWYSLPGRIAWQVIRTVVVFVVRFADAFSFAAAAVLVVVIGAIAFATTVAFYGLPLVLLAVPYLMAAVERRSELRADEHAAALGFAPMLAEVLTTMHAMELYAGKPPAEPTTLAKLLSSHPDYPTRLRRLQPYIEAQR
ncbi:M48 family metalloprotease [Streptomyces violascens]|uniref:M48 family metalloprotease n=1 Tax=Streptomyces violascens TaxID=67381 RepID=UPI0036699D85